MKSILIMTYKFPPMGGIGTRRWAKFSKYFSQNGYDVHILKAEYVYEDSTSWQHDIKKDIHIHTFKSKYPQCLLSESSTKIAMQIKRYSNYILGRLFFDLDIAQYDAKALLTQAKKIIEENNIVNVIATGHPVSMNYFSSYLKIDNPKINLIQDYRDNWNDLNVYQFGNKDGFKFFKEKEKSAYKEFFTVMYADYVVNVSKDLTDQLAKKHKSLNKFLTITNGFDRDDFKEIQISNETFNMIYTGTLFNGRINAIHLLLDAMIVLDDDYINEYFQLVIYSNYDVSRLGDKYQPYLGKNIFFKSFVSPSEIVKIVAGFSYTLSVNSSFASYAFGTKIFDYMALNKKILHISNGGVLYDILEENEQFVCDYSLETMQNVLLSIKEDYLHSKEKKNGDYNEFSLEEITSKFEKLFI